MDADVEPPLWSRQVEDGTSVECGVIMMEVEAKAQAWYEGAAEWCL
jgi:hypothetical protein